MFAFWNLRSCQQSSSSLSFSNGPPTNPADDVIYGLKSHYNCLGGILKYRGSFKHALNISKFQLMRLFVLHTRDCTSLNYIMLYTIELLKTHYSLNVLVFLI